MSSREFFGSGSIGHIRDILKDHNTRNVFLVIDKDSFFLSGAQTALSPHIEGTEIIQFAEFSPNPKIEDVRQGIALMKDAEPDLVIAVGGGSVIDMAKLINILS